MNAIMNEPFPHDTLDGFIGVLRYISDPKHRIDLQRLSEIVDALHFKIESLAKDVRPFSVPEAPLILVGAELAICAYILLSGGIHKFDMKLSQYSLHDCTVFLHEVLVDAIEVRNSRIYL